MDRHFARLSALVAVSAAFLVATCAVPGPAHAGLGGLGRTMKGKAAQVAGKKAEGRATNAGQGDDMAYDDIMLELTPERLGAVLKGLEAGKAASAGRAALVARQQKALGDADALREKHGAEIQADEHKRDTVQRCLDDGYQAAANAHQKDLSTRGQSDPAFRQQVMILSMQMAQAQAKGDTTQFKKLQDQLLGMSAPTHAESLAVQAKCGLVPAPNPLAAQLAALEKQAKDADEQVRALDDKAQSDAVQASGLEPNQFAMAKERIEMYLAAAKSGGAQHGFSSAELAALGDKRAALEAALPAQ